MVDWRLLATSALACMAWVGGARAHSGDESNEHPALLDCGELPPGALRVLPAPFNEVAHIDRQPSGQSLVQGERWIWRYPASLTTQVRVPARTPDSAVAVTGPRFFTAADVTVERGEQAAALQRRFIEEVGLHSTLASSDRPPAPREVYSLTAVNDVGQAVQIHLVQPSDRNDLWGIVCIPQCRPEYSFIATARFAR